MTLSAVFRWKHPDSTSDMNKRLQSLVPRGIFDGGDVGAGVGLTVTVSPFKAIGYDGMFVMDDAVQTLVVVAGQINYVVTRAKYVTGTTPTLDWLVLSQAAYNAHADKDYLIVFATVTLAGGAVAVTNADISYDLRDAVDPMQRSPFRGLVADPTLLPAGPPATPDVNRDGDLYFALASGGGLPGSTFYYWDETGSAWETFATGSFDVETTSMGDVLVSEERNRIEQGSGVLGGIRPAYDFASNPDISIIENPAVAHSMGIDTFSAIVNGHYAQPYARYVNMSVKPALGFRYDMIFLEVYREAIATPENHAFPRNPDGALTYTISQVSDKLETITWQAGIGGDNVDLNEMQVDDHNFLITKYRIATVDNVATQALYDPCAAAVAAGALNVDGNAFAATPGTGIDQRVLRAVSATASDGYSWAIPLFVVKRTSAEDHTINQAIMEFRGGVRYVFPVYPVADVGQASRELLDTYHREQVSAFDRDAMSPYHLPSGFIDGLDVDVQAGAVANSIKFYDGACHVRIKGLEDVLYINSGDRIPLGAPPLAPSYDRVLVYLKMSMTLYANQTTLASTYVSTAHRPYFPPQLAGTLQGQGWKRGYVTYEVVVDNFGASTELDEYDAMTSAGWNRYDILGVAHGKEYEDGGIWSKVVAIDVDDRIHPYQTQWAIPIALIHRRNTGAWNCGIPGGVPNYNGTTATRPDGETDATIIYPKQILDLRRMVDVDEARLEQMLEEDVDKLMRGQLRTRMAEKWSGAGTGGTVAGTQILQSDLITAIGSGGIAFDIPQKDYCKVYSDAREFQPISVTITLNANYTSDVADYTVATGALVIKAPTGSHIVRNLPAQYFVDAATGNATYLDFLGQPCWTTTRSRTATYPCPATLRWIKVIGVPDQLDYVFFKDEDAVNGLTTTDPAFTITARDAPYDHATQMSITLSDIAPYANKDYLMVTFWVHYDRTTTGTYASNYGLAEIPDVVHQAIRGPNAVPSDLNIGVLYTSVRKTLVASATLVVTSADVLAASGTGGTHAVIAGLAYNPFYGAALGGVTLSSTVLTSSAADAAHERDTMTLTFSAPISMDVEVVVAYYTDTVTNWIEVGKGGKSVRALFSWHEEDITFFGAAPAAYAFSLGESTWHYAEIGGQFVPMPMVFVSADGDPYHPWTQETATSVGFVNSNLVSLAPSGVAGATQYMRVTLPIWTPLSNAIGDEILIHYTYTPYQGLSGSGAVATPVTAVPLLKSMLHGTVVANTDHYVTQSGACSVYGGVETWSGAPARVPSIKGSMGADRFGAYNSTQLVKETVSSGTIDLSVVSNLADTMYAGAVMRLPFPMSPNMLTSSYHEGTFDFDLDPGREGASVGMFGYAPGYANTLVSLNGNGLQYSQFVNGVSRLCLPGETHQADCSKIIAAADFQDTNFAFTDTVYDSVTAQWLLSSGTGVALMDASLRPPRKHTIGLVACAIFAPNSTGVTAADNGLILTYPNGVLSGAAPGSYVGIGPSEYTAPVALNNSNDYYICYNPGAIQVYYSTYLDVNALLRVYMTMAGAGSDGYIGDALVIEESARSSYSASTSYAAATNAPVYADLIRIPMASSSLLGGTTALAGGMSYAIGNSSLRGRTIAYPTSWGAPTITTLETLLVASTSIHAAYGRGLYLGTTSSRFSMPVLVPGSGSALNLLLALNSVLIEKAAQPADAFPVGPATSPFATSPRRWLNQDHGGPVGYCFYGLAINPTADEYKGRVALQISGGPLMGVGGTTGAYYSPAIVDGTAIDAFWPTHRPVIRNKT